MRSISRRHRHRLGLGLAAAIALAGTTADAATKKKYHFELTTVTAKAEVKPDVAKAATPRIQGQVEKVFGGHPQLVAKLDGAPDPRTNAEGDRQYPEPPGPPPPGRPRVPRGSGGRARGRRRDEDGIPAARRTAQAQVAYLTKLPIRSNRRLRVTPPQPCHSPYDSQMNSALPLMFSIGTEPQ